MPGPRADQATWFISSSICCTWTNLTSACCLCLSARRLSRSFFGRQRKAAPIRFCDHVQGQGDAFYSHACRLGLEGVVSKLASSPYRSPRTDEWLKVKCLLRQEMVIGGWQYSNKHGRSLKSLLLGY